MALKATDLTHRYRSDVRNIHARVTAQPIDAFVLREAVASPNHGAIVVFEGVVRDHDGGRSVVELEYQVHPEAQSFIEAIAAKIQHSHPDVSIAVEHRYGHLAIGDVAFVAAVSAAHRDRAFAVCAEVVDVVKVELPIWKRQQFADGTHEWVNFA